MQIQKRKNEISVVLQKAGTIAILFKTDTGDQAICHAISYAVDYGKGNSVKEAGKNKSGQIDNNGQVGASGASSPQSGRITQFNPGRRFGFLVDEQTQQTFYVHANSIEDSLLLEELVAGQLGQHVFFQRALVSSGKYDAATSVKSRYSVDMTEQRIDKRSIDRVVPAESKTAYQRAKAAEADKKLSEAENLYRLEINNQGPNRLSAIKDLATLLNRLDKPHEALELLDRYRREFSETRSVDNLRAHFLSRAGRLEDAASLYKELAGRATGNSRLTSLRHAAYCYFGLKKFSIALATLETIKNEFSSDPATEILEKRIYTAQSERRNEIPAGEDTDTERSQLDAYSFGLTPYAKFLIDSWEPSGRPEGLSISTNYIKDLERTARRTDSEEPQGKADLLVGLASVCVRYPEFCGDVDVLDTLVLAFSSMADASFKKKDHLDTIRFYLSECLFFCSSSEELSTALSKLLVTYQSKRLVWADFKLTLKTSIARFRDDVQGWKAFEEHFPYYLKRCPAMYSILANELRKPESLPLSTVSILQVDRQKLVDSEAQRAQEESMFLDRLRAVDLTAASLKTCAQELSKRAGRTLFSLDRERLGELSLICENAAKYWFQGQHSERMSWFRQLDERLEQLLELIQRLPTELSYPTMSSLCSSFRNKLFEHVEDYRKSAVPSFRACDVLNGESYFVGEDGLLEIFAELHAEQDSAPVEGIVLQVRDQGAFLQAEEDAVFGQWPGELRAGESCEIPLLIKFDQSRLDKDMLPISVDMTYQMDGKKVPVSLPELRIRVSKTTPFLEVPNPYADYSGGASVESSEMFFGRKDLLSRITQQVTKGPPGRSFALYGQKRSGKTSVLMQLKKLIQPPCLAIKFSIGEMSDGAKDSKLVKGCLGEIRFVLLNDFGIAIDSTVTQEDILSDPIEAFHRGLREALELLKNRGWLEPRIVLLIDEFTYIYDDICAGLVQPTFMRSWKALLQKGLFQAVLIGQDTMPAFMNRFPNEFGSVTPERISYLSKDEAEDLAEKPISLAGRSRYKGNSLQQVLKLTGRSPYYMQIVCDQLVTRLNKHCRSFITASDVEAVVRELSIGSRRLSRTEFDPLIGSGGMLSSDQEESYLSLLSAIARQTSSSGVYRDPLIRSVKLDEKLADRFLTDLQERDVIQRDSAGRISITVGLFAYWLRQRFF